jgi:MFS family permease
VIEPSPDIPQVHSPYEGQQIRAGTHLKMSAYWFGSNFVWGSFLGPVLSSQMTRLAPQNSAAMLGVIYAFGALPALLVPLIAGPLSDRCTHPLGRRRPFILGGGIAAVIGILLMAFAFNIASIPLYFAGYFAIQIGSNVALASYSGLIPDLVPPDQRGKSSGYMALMSQLGTLIGAISSAVLIAKGLHTVEFILMAVVFLGFVFISMAIKEQRLPGPIPAFNWKRYFQSLWIDPRKYPDFAWVWITRALMMFGFYAIQPYLLYFLRDVIHVPDPAKSFGIVLALILVAATLSGYFGGIISDRTGRKPVVIWSSLTIAVMCIVLVFCHNLEQALVGGVIFGLGYGAYISVDWALGTDVLPDKKDAGKDMAVWHVSMTLPQQIAPLISGLILNANKSGEILDDGKKVVTYAWNGYFVVFAFAAICFLFSGLLVRKVRGAR